ncbi:unnamed protein product [Urochloa humidicola]
MAGHMIDTNRSAAGPDSVAGPSSFPPSSTTASARAAGLGRARLHPPHHAAPLSCELSLRWSGGTQPRCRSTPSSPPSPPSLTLYHRRSALHIAAANGCLLPTVLSMILDAAWRRESAQADQADIAISRIL